MQYKQQIVYHKCLVHVGWTHCRQECWMEWRPNRRSSKNQWQLMEPNRNTTYWRRSQNKNQWQLMEPNRNTTYWRRSQNKNQWRLMEPNRNTTYWQAQNTISLLVVLTMSSLVLSMPQSFYIDKICCYYCCCYYNYNYNYTVFRKKHPLMFSRWKCLDLYQIFRVRFYEELK